MNQIRFTMNQIRFTFEPDKVTTRFAQSKTQRDCLYVRFFQGDQVFLKKFCLPSVDMRGGTRKKILHQVLHVVKVCFEKLPGEW